MEVVFEGLKRAKSNYTNSHILNKYLLRKLKIVHFI